MATRRSNPSQKRRRVNNVVIFLVVFILFLVVFGLVCLWAVLKLNEEHRQQSGSNTASQGSLSTVQYTEADARNLFLVTVDGSEPAGFVVLRTDPANVRIRTMALPVETELADGTTLTTLKAYYQEKGAKESAAAVGSLLGLDFQNYAVITYANLEKMMGYFGNGVIFDIPENLSYQDTGTGYFIEMDGGRRTLTAPQMLNVLRYPQWNGGRRQTAEIQAQMVAAILNQYLVPARAAKLDADFSQFVNLVQHSDMRRSDFVAALEGIAYLLSRNTEGHLCSTISAPGEFVGGGDDLRFCLVEDVEPQLRSSLGIYAVP